MALSTGGVSSTEPLATTLADQYDLDASGVDPDEAAPATAAATTRDERGRFTSSGGLAHPAWLAAMAQDLGFTEADLSSMSSDALGVAVKHLQQSHKLTIQEQSVRQALERQQPSQPSLTETPQEIPLEGLDKANYDPDFLKAHTAAMQPILRQLKALQDRVDQIQRNNATRDSQTLTERVDRWFGQNADRYGTGSIYQVTKKQPSAAARRNAVWAELVRQKKNAGQIEDGLEEVDGMLFGDSESVATPVVASSQRPSTTQPSKNGLTEEQRLWQEAGLAVPTQRTAGPKVPGRAGGIQAIREWQKQNVETNGVSLEDFPE